MSCVMNLHVKGDYKSFVEKIFSAYRVLIEFVALMFRIPWKCGSGEKVWIRLQAGDIQKWKWRHYTASSQAILPEILSLSLSSSSLDPDSSPFFLLVIFPSSFRFPLSLTNTGSLLPAISSCRSRHLASPSQLLACFWNSWLILSLTSFKTSLGSQSQIFCVLFSSMAPRSSLSFMSSCHSHRHRPVPTEGSGANSPRKMETRSHVRPQTTTPSYQDGPSSGHELWKHELTQSITSSSVEMFFFRSFVEVIMLTWHWNFPTAQAVTHWRAGE